MKHRKKSVARKEVEQPEEIASPVESTLSGSTFRAGRPGNERGTGDGSAGQAGDTQGLSREELAESESVEELVEEGQAHEAEIISAVEDAPDPDQGEVRTRKLPEDKAAA
jgi:hypothetical protein